MSGSSAVGKPSSPSLSSQVPPPNLDKSSGPSWSVYSSTISFLGTQSSNTILLRQTARLRGNDTNRFLSVTLVLILQQGQEKSSIIESEKVASKHASKVTGVPASALESTGMVNSKHWSLILLYLTLLHAWHCKRYSSSKLNASLGSTFVLIFFSLSKNFSSRYEKYWRASYCWPVLNSS